MVLKRILMRAVQKNIQRRRKFMCVGVNDRWWSGIVEWVMEVKENWVDRWDGTNTTCNEILQIIYHKILNIE